MSVTSSQLKVVKIFVCSKVSLLKATVIPSEPAFCIDVRAPRSVAGKQQLYVTFITLRLKTIPRCSSLSYFRFSDVVVKSLGMIEVALATTPFVPDIMALMDIVPVNIPALLGVEVLDS